MAETKDVSNRFIAKLFSIEFLCWLAISSFGAGGAYWALANGQERQDKEIESASSQMHRMAIEQKKEFVELKSEINQLQILNARIQAQQESTDKNIDRILTILERQQ
jgi:hypothetical protein